MGDRANLAPDIDPVKGDADVRSHHRTRFLASAFAALTVVGVLAGCSRAAENTAPAANAGAATEVRLGFFPNVTHAPALIGVKKDFFKQELGSTKLTTQTFNAGPDEVNALLGNSLDIAYIGSGPAINAFTKSKGTIQLISGAVSGGAQLVVKPDIASVDALKGKNIATPQLANTQDVALKKFLAGEEPDRPGQDHQPGQLEDARRLQEGRGRRRLAARAVVVAAGPRQPARRSWSTRRTCGPAAGSRPPSSSCAASSCRSTRTPSAPC